MRQHSHNGAEHITETSSPGPSRSERGLTVQSILSSTLDMDRTVRTGLGIRLLSHESRLIFKLFVEGCIIVKEASLSSQLSSRAFYELLKRLEREEVIFFEKNSEDRRAKSICLDKVFKKRFEDYFENNEMMKFIMSIQSMD